MSKIIASKNFVKKSEIHNDCFFMEFGLKFNFIVEFKDIEIAY